MAQNDIVAQVRDAIDDLALEDMAWTAVGVEGYELARAMLFALARIHGKAFVDSVSDELARRRDALLAGRTRDETEPGHLLEHSDIWNDLDAAEALTESASRPTKA